MKLKLAMLVATAILSCGAHAITNDDARFVQNGVLDWTPKETFIAHNVNKDHIFISKDSGKLNAPFACKYLPLRDTKATTANRLFYVETSQYTKEQLNLIKRTCAYGNRAIDVVSAIPADGDSSVGRVISRWTRYYQDENKYYVKDSNWIALADKNDNSITVTRTISLFKSDPDIIIANEKTSNNNTSDKKDPFLEMYSPSPFRKLASHTLRFSWKISSDGHITPVSAYADKLSTQLNKNKSFGSFV